MTPAAKKEAVRIMMHRGISRRQACRMLEVSRSLLGHTPKQPEKDKVLIEPFKLLSQQYPRFGYRRIGAMPAYQRKEPINTKRVYRIRKILNLQLPKRRPKKKRPGNNSITPVSIEANHVRNYDFVSNRTADGRKLKIPAPVDEYTRECLALEPASSIPSSHVIDTFGKLMSLYGKPAFIRSNNGPELITKAVIQWLTSHRIDPAFIEPGSPWQNGFIESFNGKFKDECLSREWFASKKETQVIIEQWRHHDNHERPHSDPGYRPPSEVSGRQHAA